MIKSIKYSLVKRVKFMWDLIVVGGGTSGVAAAVSAARNGCKNTLLIEKNSFLGGTQSGSLVTPMMSNALKSGEKLSSGFFDEICERLASTGDSVTYKDGNPAWFNPEMLKCVYDDFCDEAGVKVLFDTVIVGANVEGSTIKSIQVANNSGITTLEAKYFVDASGDAILSYFAGVGFDSGDNGANQSMSLRFNMANVDLEKFAKWILELDPDSGVTSVDYKPNGEIHLSTACTWDDKGWKLKPYFDKAVEDGVITLEDSAYFQIFTMPGQKNAVSFNCPRIYASKSLDTLNMWDTSYALTMGRKQIRRIAEFCKIYLPGFEESYVSLIAPKLGVRDSRRIHGKYTLTEQDIAAAKKFESPVAKSNYPVDVHSKEKNNSELVFLTGDNYYEVPLESLIPDNIENMLVVGRCISATFRAQASLRVQPNCITMGEAAAMYIANKLYDNNQ